MGRRIICVVLSLIMAVLLLSEVALGENLSTIYTREQKEEIYYKYKGQESSLNELFCNDSNIGYWNTVDKIESNGFLSWVIEKSSIILEELPDKKDYAEILANLIVMQEGDFAETVAEQSSFDDLKDTGDYINDIIGIAESFIGANGILEDISTIISAATGGKDVIIDNLETAKYYQISIQCYAQESDFLSAVSKYAKNEELRKAAETLLKAADTLFQKRLEYLNSHLESLKTYGTNFYMENLSFNLLKTADLYDTDDIVKCFVDCGEKLTKSILSVKSTAEFAFQGVMLAGNIAFGTTNTFNRYQEMKAVADIAGAIVKANNQIQVSSDTQKVDFIGNVQSKVNYYKMVLVTHARGEYLIYQLLIKDAGILSQIQSLVDDFKSPSETTEGWYNDQIDVFLLYYNILNNLFDVADYTEKIPEGAVEFEGHYYYLYDTDTVFTYEAAMQYCEDKGGYLATITSQEENDFLYDYITKNKCLSAYFGLSDSVTEGDWQWGNGETSSYTNWHSGEPNSKNSNEDFAMYYYKYPDGTWNDGDFREENGGRAFLCEWGDYETGYADVQENMERSEEREIVLVLDISSSMAGTPLDETKKASLNFIDTVLKEDAATGIVTYSNSAERVSDFSTKETVLQDGITYLQSSGNTDIESGLQEAEYMLDGSNAKKKIMVLMSDGEPNSGKTGNDLISYADSIKEKGIMIYTLGFFENLGDKSGAQQLMEDIASEGCHYEVANADDLVFFFQDIADQINGQKYIYVRIACPVDVSVTYNGQTLSSSEMDRNERTDFGTLTFEDAEDSNGQNLEDAAQDADEQIKILRLKEENDYDLKITGNGYGMMNYTIGFMDDDGTYNDFREFRDIRITRKTQIDTVAAVSSESILNIDENGDGKYDLKLRAVKNGYGEEVKLPQWIIYAVGGASILILIDVIIIIIKVRRKRKGNF